ncbi:cobalamin biosynthesis protein [Streptomyces longispororuber]|uniref:cobalamin biosynthesis protein n=1 Tax=Streptomyces longispororuber TaxID=68230 RepID=UPI00210EB576|nr:cobalamin biosynthesis protein [Streptomyces longispororuber]MCQ4213721.1 cobalamin biosynthesis protein [Streptomyces longispororuber]
MLTHPTPAPHVLTGSGRVGRVVVGVGARAGVAADEVLGLVRAVLAEAGAGAGDLVALATVDAKGREPGLVRAAEVLGVPVETYPAERLAAVPVPHPSERVRGAVGTPSVAEAAALVRGGRLLVAKRVSAGAGGAPGRVTCAAARTG